jgi:hypothetical protein
MNYYELNLPFPLKKEKLQELIILKCQSKSVRHYAYVCTQFEDFISDELAEVFNNLNIWPNVMIVFGHMNNANRSKSIIHSDLILKDDHFVRVPFGLNYEIGGIKARFNWFTPKSGVEEMLFDGSRDIWKNIKLETELDTNLPEVIWASGAHYGKIKNYNKDDFNLIDTYELSRKHACLVRTNIPHSVSYGEEVKERLSVSFRFSEERIASIEDASKIFNSYSL